MMNVTVLFSSCTAYHFVILLYSVEPGLTLNNILSFVLLLVLFSCKFLTTSRIFAETFFP